MTEHSNAAYGALLLRMALGGLFLAHAALKIFVFTPAGASQFFGSLGVAPDLAYIVIGAEVIGGVALILGVFARATALALLPILIGSIALVHGPAGFFFTQPNGGWEFPAFWAVALIVQALIGDGALALVPTKVRGVDGAPKAVLAE